MKKIFILCLCLVIASCAMWQNRKENIVNKELILVSKDGTKYQKPPFIIIKADGRLAGSTGCNRIIGKAYFGDAGEVIFKEVASTKMLCSQDGELEEKFLSILNQTLHYHIENNNTVYLMDGNMNRLVQLRIK